MSIQYTAYSIPRLPFPSIKYKLLLKRFHAQPITDNRRAVVGVIGSYFLEKESSVHLSDPKRVLRVVLYEKISTGLQFAIFALCGL